MADELRIGLTELLRKAMIDQDADFLKEGVRVLSQALMEMEVEQHVGAGQRVVSHLEELHSFFVLGRVRFRRRLGAGISFAASTSAAGWPTAS